MPFANDIDSLIKNMLAGDVRSLSRLMTRVERYPDEVPRIMRAVYPNRRPARRIGLSGPPGAGKSTTLGNLIKRGVDAGRKVGVLCIDPTSPLTGGAILGDRIRITEMFPPEQVFIRSVASGDSLGGLAAATKLHALLLEAAGCDLVLIETVGLGQVGYDITDVAETFVLLIVPESGDTVQILKSGIIELADIVVVNKADRDGAGEIAETLRLSFMDPRNGWQIPVIMSVAREDKGTDEIMDALKHHLFYLREDGKLASFRSPDHDFINAVSFFIKRTLNRDFLATHPVFKTFHEKIMSGDMDPYTAAALAMNTILGQESA